MVFAKASASWASPTTSILVAHSSPMAPGTWWRRRTTERVICACTSMVISTARLPAAFTRPPARRITSADRTTRLTTTAATAPSTGRSMTWRFLAARLRLRRSRRSLVSDQLDPLPGPPPRGRENILMEIPTALVLNAVVAGLLLGGFYAAMSVGVSISFGMLDVVNIAHPGFIILGSYIAYIVNDRLGV